MQRNGEGATWKTLSRRTALRWLGLGLLAAACPGMVATAVAAASEADKIESLIRTIETLQDAAFVRNGDTHNGKEAGAHLRRKWGSKKGSIQTARDFVLLLASKSALTGRPYLIRWRDGREQTSESFLLAELKKLETAPAAAK